MYSYLSIVMVGRNDSYGGNFVQRLQTSLQSLYVLADRHSLELEIVLVDWNPPEENAALGSVIETPERDSPVSLKIIQVPTEVHHQFPRSDSIPLFEYRAKNVGIRRATGQFILATNPDIIFSDPLISYLAEQRLSERCFYRINRLDVDGDVQLDTTDIDTMLQQCSENIIRVLARDGSKIKRLSLFRRLGFSHFIRNPTEIKRPLRLLTNKILPDGIGQNGNQSAEESIPVESIDDVATNAAGDFLLLSRPGWYHINGFPEVNIDSHADSYGTFIASSRGYEQIYLTDPIRIYHQEHNRDRLDRVDHRPDWDDIAAEGQKILQGAHSEVVNDDTWGLRGQDLPVEDIE